MTRKDYFAMKPAEQVAFVKADGKITE